MREREGEALPDLPAPSSPPPRIGPALHRSRQLLFLVILLPLIALAFIAILALQHQRIEELRVGLAERDAELTDLRAQNAFYKKAYEITLDDIKVLSGNYGGEDRYERLASDLREKELGTILGEQSPDRTYRLRNPLLWKEYQEKGIISTSCLATPMVADTIQDEVLLTLQGSAENVSVYIDGNYLEAIPLASTATLSVVIPNGAHELDLVMGAPGEVTGILLDTVALGSTTADHGSGWKVFDCQDAITGGTTTGPGAIRVLFTKN